MPQSKKLSFKQQREVQNLVENENYDREDAKAEFDDKLNDMLEGYQNKWDKDKSVTSHFGSRASLAREANQLLTSKGTKSSKQNDLFNLYDVVESEGVELFNPDEPKANFEMRD